METFDFYMDCKVTCWERTRFSIKANSYEEAKSIILSWEEKDVNSHIGMDENVIYCDYELNPDTVEGLSPAENETTLRWKSTDGMTSCFITICWTNNRAKL